MDKTIRIAGAKTVADWISFRAKLETAKGAALWKQAGTDYFDKRVQTRYIQPIRLLRYNKVPEGEGFSIVTLQCALIEFLAATVLGKNYRHPKPLNDFEYSKSQPLFEDFLSNSPPFKVSPEAAREFYVSVRCGLLHEARTKNSWRIRTEKPGSPAIDASAKTVYRNTLQNDLEEFIRLYRERLIVEPALQAAFIRKFDYLADVAREPAPKNEKPGLQTGPSRIEKGR